MPKYRRIAEVVDGNRIDSHGWVITRANGTKERIPEHVFLKEWEILPEITTAVSKINPMMSYVIIMFTGTTPTRRLMSLDMIKQWDAESGWTAMSGGCNAIISSGGTFIIPAESWLIFKGKTFLFHCSQEYFEKNMNIEEGKT
jgi:hypothetical protein